jgi:hypothetical protein
MRDTWDEMAGRSVIFRIRRSTAESEFRYDDRCFNIRMAAIRRDWHNDL